jgi:hypothetical protein
MPTFEVRYAEKNGEKVTSFIGPKAVRISPLDIVFDPTVDFNDSFKIVRTMTKMADIVKHAKSHPHEPEWQNAIDKRMERRKAAVTYANDDWEKAAQYVVDGFGSLQEYYLSDTVELLEFYGDFYDSETNEYKPHRMITVMDRSVVVRDVDIPTYSGEAPIRHAGWRKRNDNTWAQGPLDLLIGMQYLIDHYLNMSANALDLKVMPPLKVIGDVEDFDWNPREEIHIDENGDVQEIGQEFGDIITSLNYIAELEERMEQYAGAPREAMGIRTPGEKTAFEIQALENAAGS